MRVYPLQEVVTPGITAPFTCEVINNNDVEQLHWLVNGTRLEDLNLGDSVADFMSQSRVRGLVFLHVPVEYNGTTIQCIAISTSGDIMYSINASLLVQGEEKYNYANEASC